MMIGDTKDWNRAVAAKIARDQMDAQPSYFFASPAIPMAVRLEGIPEEQARRLANAAVDWLVRERII